MKKASLKINNKHKLILKVTLGCLLLITLPLILFVAFQTSQSKSNANTTLNYDVVVVGGGTGGVSAAIQAARAGSRVAIVEPTDWLGGQMTAAAVSSIDEGYVGNSSVERDSGLYGEFVRRVAQYYGGIERIHKCYFYAESICVEPGAANQILQQMVSGTGRIDVFYRNTIAQVQKSSNTITGVLTHSNANNDDNVLNAKIVIDATEYGDVIPLTGANYRVGKYLASSGIGEAELNSCIQDITYPATIKKYTTIPANLKVTEEPPNYQNVRYIFQRELYTASATYVGYTPFPWSMPQFAGYRGIPDKTNPSTTTAENVAGLQSLTKSAINVPGNDMAQTIRFLQDPSFRKAQSCEAKLRTIQYLYYMQKDLGLTWSVADDEGFETAYNLNENNCPNIPAAFKEIEKRLPLGPYVRESRRIVGINTLTSQQVLAQKLSDHKTSASVKPVSFNNSIAIGGYGMDLHNCNTSSTIDPNIDTLDAVTSNNSKFQVPIEALIPQSVDGFLAAEKNISQGRMANGGTRLQPITMLTGQAAGALAGIAVRTNRQPRAVAPIEVQNILLDNKSPISLYDLNDVPMSNPRWKAIQLISNYHIMAGFGDGNFGPDLIINRGIMGIVLTRLLEIPNINTPQDAYNALRERNLTTAPSFVEFNANEPTLRGQLALFIARVLGQNPSDGPNAINWLQSISIGVGCNSDANTCNMQAATRADMAEAVSGALTRIKVTGYTPPAPQPTTPPASPQPTTPPPPPTSSAQACPAEFQGFYDVVSDYQPAAKCFNEKYCIVRGFSAHMLGPNDILTRAQYVAFILRYHDQIVGDWKIISQEEVNSLPMYPNKIVNPETGNEQFRFPDVEPSNSLAREIYTSQKYGFIRGYTDGYFRPDTLWMFGFHGVNRNDQWPLGSTYDFTHDGAQVKRIDFLRGLYTYGRHHNTLPACNDLPNINYP